ncbi:hypothetical protein C6401_15185 [Arthrobacter woluwensis]|uniref:hypothetical protein n=1 Tax=Arthrobacter woluwensis TaxID=156980 RepID=UPI000D12BD29|nr:hypothetical protein [Arthrobacter woluwensis]PSS42901.1 hypothetical protein C6401_15185 [Arthrobacter woluwensis]
MTTPTPETFDLNGWLSDSAPPQASATVYGRGDLAPRIQELGRTIDSLRGTEVTDGEPELRALESERDELLRIFGDARLVVHVQSISPRRLEELRAIADKEEPVVGERGTEKYMASMRANSRRLGLHIFSNAIVRIQAGLGEPQDVAFTPDDVAALEDRLGPGQWEAVNAAYEDVQQRQFTPDADFLR